MQHLWETLSNSKVTIKRHVYLIRKNTQAKQSPSADFMHKHPNRYEMQFNKELNNNPTKMLQHIYLEFFKSIQESL